MQTSRFGKFRKLVGDEPHKGVVGNFIEDFRTMREFENSELKLKGKIYGSSPVQAEGTIKGFQFYFRSRHDTWTFSVSENPEIDPVDIQMNNQGKKFGYFAEGHIGKEWEYIASYLDEDKVKDIIQKCSKDYLDSK
jgi:hypothetical protein